MQQKVSAEKKLWQDLVTNLRNELEQAGLENNRLFNMHFKKHNKKLFSKRILSQERQI